MPVITTQYNKCNKGGKNKVHWKHRGDKEAFQKMPQLSSDMKDENFLSRQMERELPGEKNTFTKIYTLEPSGFVEMQIFFRIILAKSSSQRLIEDEA